MEPLNLATLPKYLSDEAAAWELLESLRWPEGEVVCPHCGVIDSAHYFISARSGDRQTRTGKTTYRRLWRCRDCRKQFSVLVGTIFESTKIPVSKWLLAMWLFNAGKNGVSAQELQRHLGISYQSAWFMAHRLREAMTRRPLSTLLTGTVVSDETWVGGVPKNRHAWQRVGSKQGLTDKTPVVDLVHKETGEVRTRVVANVNGENLREVLTDTCVPAETHLHTDSSNVYTAPSREGIGMKPAIITEVFRRLPDAGKPFPPKDRERWMASLTASLDLEYTETEPSTKMGGQRAEAPTGADIYKGAMSPSSDDFEEFVAAALKVDPKGLSGKHRWEPETPDEPDRESGCDQFDWADVKADAANGPGAMG